MTVKDKELEKTEEMKFDGVEKSENFFSKEQLLHSERFQDRKDLMNALLSPDKQYTMKQAEQKMENYMKGKVR